MSSRLDGQIARLEVLQVEGFDVGTAWETAKKTAKQENTTKPPVPPTLSKQAKDQYDVISGALACMEKAESIMAKAKQKTEELRQNLEEAGREEERAHVCIDFAQKRVDEARRHAPLLFEKCVAAASAGDTGVVALQGVGEALVQASGVMGGLFQKLAKVGQVLVHEPPPAELPDAKKTKGENGGTVKPTDADIDEDMEGVR